MRFTEPMVGDRGAVVELVRQHLLTQGAAATMARCFGPATPVNDHEQDERLTLSLAPEYAWPSLADRLE